MRKLILIMALLQGSLIFAQNYGGIDLVSTNVSITGSASADDDATPFSDQRGCSLLNLPLQNLGSITNPIYGNPASDFARYCLARAVDSGTCISTDAEVSTGFEVGGDASELIAQFQINSNAYHQTETGIGYSATAISNGDLTIELLVPPSTNLPAGQAVLINYDYDIWLAAAGNSEAACEDFAEINIQNFDLNGIDLLQAATFPSSASSCGQLDGKQLKFSGSLPVTVGTPFLFEISGNSEVTLENPGIDEVTGCGLQWDDFVSCTFFGNLRMSIHQLPPSPTPPISLPGASLFSVDIGGDRELSDPLATGNEIFDPGDLYKVANPTFPSGGGDGLLSDDLFFPTDIPPSAPDPFPAATAAPVGSGVPAFIVGPDYFDIDAFDILDFVPSEIVDGGTPNPAPAGSPCLNRGDYLFLSFDDDAVSHYADPTTPSVPSNSTFSSFSQRCYGSGSLKDEMFESFNSGPFLGGLSSLVPVATESNFHPQLGPNPAPIGPSSANDDVDALNLSYTLGCDIGLISVDHEATGTDASGVALNPSTIYRFTAPGSPLIPTISSGAIGVLPETDIDAIEFISFFNPNLASSGRVLAMLFSVDSDDPYTMGVDESGGLDPGRIYISYLNGAAVEFDPGRSYAGDIDAISSLPNALNSGLSSQTCNPTNFQLPPQNFTATVNPSNVDLNWLTYPFATGCIVSGNRANAANDVNIVLSGSGNAPNSYSIPFSQLQPGANYRVRVRCGCSPGNLSPYTPYLFFSTPPSPSPGPITDIFGSAEAEDAMGKEPALELHPNPANGFVILSATDVRNGSATVNVFNALGQLVKSEVIDAKWLASGYRLNTEELSTGWYTVQVIDDSRPIESALYVTND
jgi:hypothetical protein